MSMTYMPACLQCPTDGIITFVDETGTVLAQGPATPCGTCQIGLTVSFSSQGGSFGIGYGSHSGETMLPSPSAGRPNLDTAQHAVCPAYAVAPRGVMGCVTACHHVLAWAEMQVVCLFKAGVMKSGLLMPQRLASSFHTSLVSRSAWPKKWQCFLGTR